MHVRKAQGCAEDLLRVAHVLVGGTSMGEGLGNGVSSNSPSIHWQLVGPPEFCAFQRFFVCV